ncbi:glycosyltransferase family 2 protein [Geomesophilobacter sediminis]|uniref:Glycosyltransferase family 2 protein n=1 Tax=Geomesophilobacter sediminis TaxID=2798584 RepID=A0A8J7J007_9BACT|nr:glycosyltransferase family 2 protein [Geomesophilobacter sediminis]MBJ6723673.1 glycosyltransferase family 2 protein [Geomesophilobacter sediminis]
MAAIFWLSLFLVVYTYLGYPLCLALLARFRSHPVAKGAYQPTVSVVFAACNEEGNIVRRLENLLAQEYPKEKLEVIVVSDGSKDRTAELARGFAGRGVTVVELTERSGKAVALNAGVARARGEVLLFCDARQSFDPEVVRELGANFADPRVGCVSGELLLLKKGSSGIQVEMGAYWSYEKWIRKRESDTGSVIGATGAIFAVRRSLFRDLPHGTLLDDVFTPMSVVLQGYRVVFEPAARARDQVSQEISQEWVRKVRTLAGNWQLIGFIPGLLSPGENPCFWRFLSHKVLRLVVPVALILLLASGAHLPGFFYQVATWLQLGFYLLAALGGAWPATRSNRIVNLCYFFLVMNLVAVAGFWRWARGQSASVWKPAYVKPGE